jgi:hypothetical protein
MIISPSVPSEKRTLPPLLLLTRVAVPVLPPEQPMGKVWGRLKELKGWGNEPGLPLASSLPGIYTIPVPANALINRGLPNPPCPT